MKAVSASSSTKEKQQPEEIAMKLRFPEKYRKGLKGNAMIAVLRRQEEHPDWLLKDVLADIIKNANPEMPSAFLLEFTQHIIAWWEHFDLKKNEDSQIGAVSALA